MWATAWVTIGEMPMTVIGIMPRATNAGGIVGGDGIAGGNDGGLTEADAKVEADELTKVDNLAKVDAQ